MVGAGPGRPDLLTLRGAQCLGRADAVVVDALVDRRVLSHARPGAEIVDAGKRGHSRTAMPQESIHRILLRLARAGKTVVRLKGGDPYLFGRGGEEAEFLARHKIPFEVVPGVSSVTAVPAYAGIPLTHRDHASWVTVVTGHRSERHTSIHSADAAQPPTLDVDWKELPVGGTLVILMGVRQLPEIVRQLLGAGWPGQTPVAAVQWGTCATQKTVRGTLKDILYRTRRSGLSAPAVIVVGGVAGLGGELGWFERLPLFGRTVFVTRARTQASNLVRLLEEQGARVVECPVIRIQAFPLSASGRKYLRGLAEYDAVLLTSANAAEILIRHWKAMRRSWPDSAAIYAVGPKTADICAAAGLSVKAVAQEFVAESLADVLGVVGGKRFLFPRAQEGRDVLLETLRRRGASVDLWPVYRTLPEKISSEARRSLLAGEVDAVTFTSSSTVANLLGQLPAAARRRIFKRTAAASIGSVTTATLRQFGIKPQIRAQQSTVEELAAAVANHFSHRRS